MANSPKLTSFLYDDERKVNRNMTETSSPDELNIDLTTTLSILGRTFYGFSLKGILSYRVKVHYIRTVRYHSFNPFECASNISPCK